MALDGRPPGRELEELRSLDLHARETRRHGKMERIYHHAPDDHEADRGHLKLRCNFFN